MRFSVTSIKHLNALTTKTRKSLTTSLIRRPIPVRSYAEAPDHDVLLARLKEVEKIHSYDTPCIIKIPIKPNERFGEWIFESLK